MAHVVPEEQLQSPSIQHRAGYDGKTNTHEPSGSFETTRIFPFRRNCLWRLLLVAMQHGILFVVFGIVNSLLCSSLAPPSSAGGLRRLCGRLLAL